MYKIGEFSKIVNIPIRTLRYYDDYGLLKPSVIDNFTGYRYYTEENIIECELIKLLKSLDFTLEEIASYKDTNDPEIITNKRLEYENKMKLLELKYKRLTILEKELKNKEKILRRNDL